MDMVWKISIVERHLKEFKRKSFNLRNVKEPFQVTFH